MRSTIEATCQDLPIDLVLWLAQCGTTIIGSAIDVPQLDATNWLANRMGQQAHLLEPMLRMIKKSLNGKPHQVSLSLGNLSTNQVQQTIQFGILAHRNGLFEYFYRDHHHQKLTFRLQDDPRVVGFFTGGWFEAFVLEVLVRRLSLIGAGDESTVLTNTKVQLPDGQDAELDILVSTFGRVIWLECKSGSYSSYLKRYGAIAQNVFRVPPEQAALVILDPLTSDEQANLGLISGMSVINVTDLDRFLDRALTHPRAQGARRKTASRP